MGDDIGLGSVTDCLLMLFSDLKRQTELHYEGWGKNKFEVSKIYMTACICIYKFCQIKKIFVRDFFLFY